MSTSSPTISYTCLSAFGISVKSTVYDIIEESHKNINQILTPKSTKHYSKRKIKNYIINSDVVKNISNIINYQIYVKRRVEIIRHIINE